MQVLKFDEGVERHIKAVFLLGTSPLLEPCV